MLPTPFGNDLLSRGLYAGLGSKLNTTNSRLIRSGYLLQTILMMRNLAFFFAVTLHKALHSTLGGDSTLLAGVKGV